MKRRIEDSAAKVEGIPPHQIQRTTHTGSSVVQTNFSSNPTLKIATPGEISTIQQTYPLQSYATMPSITTNMKAQSSAVTASSSTPGTNPPPSTGGILVQPHIRQNKVAGGAVTVPTTGAAAGGTPVATAGANQPTFQRLKVEDALSYLDQVKYKFNNQPQVYNDFLEIMKEFKSQCIDTPGVITRVSNLFKGYPELISGFNTFLPPGYKIEVQANDTGYSLQVSVSNPHGHHTMTEIPPLTPTQPPTVVVTNHQPKVPPTVFGSFQVANACSSLEMLSSSKIVSTNRTSPGLITAGGKPLTDRAAASGGASALQVLGNSGLPTSQPANHQSTNQPVEFNHAINYVNKIKNRFQGQPDKYKKFLEILHTYQKEQRNVKESPAIGTGVGKLTEAEVYSQVAQLFENHDDLLAEFGQFLPDATSHNTLSLANFGNKIAEQRVKSSSGSGGGKYHSLHGGSGGGGGIATNNKSSPPTSKPSLGSKRSSSELYSSSHASQSHPQSPSGLKRQKIQPSTVSNSSHSLQNHKYFEQFVQLKKCLRNSTAYENLLRCVHLYNCEVISRTELVVLLTPLLEKHSQHLSWLKDTLGVADIPLVVVPPSPTLSDAPLTFPSPALPSHHRDPPESSTALDIDFTTCRRIGASYCALPKGTAPPRCSGRTQLCRQVLNDTWVSFPTYSEDAVFVTSRKTQYEEFIYRCEDERFELDLIIECNASTIRVLESIQKKMNRMNVEELAKFRLDDTLGGTSSTIHIKALKRIYGDKAADIVEGLKKSPNVAVPVVLKRLKAKESEWRQAQKGFNKVWREQNEKYYLKSLDHQGITFKQNDLKAIRSKPLYNEIETAYEEQEREDGKGGPHMVLNYPADKTILDDAANLLIHHVKRQATTHKDDKSRIKQLLRHFIPDMFHHRRQELSDDEQDSDEKVEVDNNSNEAASPSNTSKKEVNGPVAKDSEVKIEVKEEEDEDPEAGSSGKSDSLESDDVYTLFFGNNYWYLFLRLHHILCERLAKMAAKSKKISAEEAINSVHRKESTAVALRLKPNEHCQDCYGAMLEMVKSALDCSLDPTTYEDSLRNMFGIHAYIGFTLDRIVINAVRQIQLLVSEENSCEMWDLYQKMKSEGGAGGQVASADSRSPQEAAYHKKAVSVLADSTMDNCYKFHIYNTDSKVTIELVDTETEEDNKPPPDERMSDDTPALSAEDTERFGKAVFLKRNVRDWEKRNKEMQKLKELDKLNSVENNKLVVGGEPSNARCLLLDERVIFAHKDKLLYRGKALGMARKNHGRVSKRKLEKMERWYRAWARDHVSPSAEEKVQDWFLGRIDGLKPELVTNQVKDSPTNRPPYRPFNRYTVHER